MWTSLSAGRWICLFGLATLTPISAWKGKIIWLPTPSPEPTPEVLKFLLVPCCIKGGRYTPFPITSCIKEKPTLDCKSRNYAIQVGTDKWYCIDHRSRWMKWQIRTGKVSCPVEPVYNY